MANENPNQLASESRSSPIDAYVGSRIRLRRTLLGLSQERLGDSLGLTFQQVQKYERGANRVGASRLFEISRVLDVPISYFFDDMPEDMLETPVSGRRGRMSGVVEWQEPSNTLADDKLARRETLALLWHILLGVFCEEHVTVRTSSWRGPFEEVEDRLPDCRHARLWRRSLDSFFFVPPL